MTIGFDGEKKTYGLVKSTAYVFGYNGVTIYQHREVKLFHCDKQGWARKVAEAVAEIRALGLWTVTQLPFAYTGDHCHLTARQKEYLEAVNISGLWHHVPEEPDGIFVKAEPWTQSLIAAEVIETQPMQTRFIEVPSKSKPTETHKVHLNKDGQPVSCECKGFYWRHHCDHMKQAKELCAV